MTANRRSRAPCPVCRAELGASSTWREIQEAILQMSRNLRFEKIKNRFVSKKMKKTMEELETVKKKMNDIQKIMVDKEENDGECEQEGENEEDFPDIICLN